MKRTSLGRIAVSLLVLVGLAVAVGTPLWAGACGGTCPQCQCRTCEPVPVKTTQEKHCWEIVCKDICIPSFKWPWESCCEPPPCGRVRTVKQLKKVTYKCEKCGYKWEAPSVTCQADK
jgi:hypothetical protein